MSNEDKFNELIKNCSNFGYKDDYYKMRDFTAALVREINDLNNELNKFVHDSKYGTVFEFEDNTRKFVPILGETIGITHKGQRPLKFTNNFNLTEIENWIESHQYTLKR